MQLIEAENRRALSIKGDIGEEKFCQEAVRQTLQAFGKLDILVNNAAEQHLEDRLEDISTDQLERTFRSNVFGYFYMTKAALPHMREGSCIINTTSVTAYKGSAHLMDYSATRGAIVSFTRSLSQAVVDRGIRVNAVAPGLIWTPLVAASFDAEGVRISERIHRWDGPGSLVKLLPVTYFRQRRCQLHDGQVLHPNGGTIVAG